ncbi:hypothetical protein [Rubrivirga sp. IMCC45206]|uniref:hypothetical protein n=1 Tax=Rubrivirga sp. IMCC45206 TaxID=3391614 RepID=UPI0039903935
MKHFVDNIELYLSGAGLLVVWAAAAVLAPLGIGVWQIAAVTALGVSVLHGAIFWVVRRRQRRIRSKSVHDIREMLLDQVKNQLAVMQMWIPEGTERKAYEDQFDGINEAIAEIDQMMDGLTEEKLKAWKSTYRNAAAHVRFDPSMA